MISEIMLGREARTDAVSGLIKLAPKGQPWWLIAAMGVSAAFIMSFYSEVAAWVFAYIFKAASGEILSTDPAVTGLPSIRSSRIPCRVCSGSGWCWP
jgi:NSS family neurotransmitter:Na+ symporter